MQQGSDISFSLKRSQKWLGPRSFFVCVLAIELFAILAIDMYAPALPSMQETFDVSIGYLNLTMFAFFFISAFATFLTGPVSDCVGRKPFLVSFTVLFAVSSAGCALSPTVELLVLFRVLQGVSVGGIQTLSTALIQDAYTSHSVKTAMTFLQSLVIIGPVLAPFLGSFILMSTNWRGIFGILAALGAVTVVLSLLVTETHCVTKASLLTPLSMNGSGSAEDAENAENTNKGEHTEGAPLKTNSFGVLFRKVALDCKNLVSSRSFLSLALIMGFAGVPFFAFIATVSYILMNYFSLGYVGYSLIYAAACLLDCIAPFVYLFLAKHMPHARILRVSIALIAISGIALLVVGGVSPVVFFFAFAPYALAEGIIRPLAYVDLLNQPDDRVGSASSLTNFSYALITAIATVVATLDWSSLIGGLGVITVATTVCVVLLYVWGYRR